MSGLYAEKLRRRAESFLSVAEKVSDPDLAMFMVEQGLQLYIKSIYFELFGSVIRGHRVRELLSALARALDEQGFRGYAERVVRFVDEYRRTLIDLEEAYTEARYGGTSYTQQDVARSLEVAKKLVGLLEEVRRSVKLG